MLNGHVNTSKHVRIVRQDNRYWRIEYNQYTDSYKSRELIFDDNGKCTFKEGNWEPTFDKAEIDVLISNAAFFPERPQI